MITVSSPFTQRNQGVERALRILELLSAGQASLSLQDISNRLDLHASTTHRLLKTLEEQDYLARLPGSDQYRLGPKVLTLASRMLNNVPVRELAAPHIRRLSLELGESVALATYDAGDTVYLDCAEGLNTMGVFLRPGGRGPALSVASGRVQLAFRDAIEVQHLLDQHASQQSGGGTDLTPTVVLDELALIRERGYAIDDNALPGIRAAAAPILDANSTAVAAITVVGLAGRLTLERLHHMLGRLCSTARDISVQYGYPCNIGGWDVPEQRVS